MTDNNIATNMLKLLLIVVIIFNFCDSFKPTIVAKFFWGYDIVPDIIDIPPLEPVNVCNYSSIDSLFNVYLAFCCVLCCCVQVIYPDDVSAMLGNELKPFSVKDVPRVRWDADPLKLYTLLLVDPDAPSRTNPTERSYRHWLVINIPGCDVNNGQIISDYVEPAPTIGSGLHRYVFLVYEQLNGCIANTEPIVQLYSGQERSYTNVRLFATLLNLSSPIFGNFFRAQSIP